MSLDRSPRGARVLVIEDDPIIRGNAVELLSEEGYEVVAADNGATGLSLAKARRPELILCDIMLPELDGYGVLKAVREFSGTADIPFIFLTAKADRADVRAGMNLGADDYITKPFTLSELLEAVRTRLRRAEEVALRTRAAVAEECEPSEAAPATAFAASDGVIVAAPGMRAIYAQAARAASSNIPVLILGETGVGKEILARAVHNLSPRKKGPFVALNCAALTEPLLESELFGHERGAFTGAVQARPGLFESAASGTVFLDEVGELSLSIQVKLLRVLEERRVLRVGSRSEREVDIRFVAATNRDLERETSNGGFREDLFYRLNRITFTVPPLRERRVEIAPLARMFLARACAEQGRSALVMSPEYLGALEAYAWPGNVRELRNVIERGAVLCSGDRLLCEHLPAKVCGERGTEAPPPDGAVDRRAQLQQELHALERERIAAAIERANGNQTIAAELLGISRRTLVYRLTALGLPRPRKR